MSKLTMVQTNIHCFNVWEAINESTALERVSLIASLIPVRSGTFQKRKPFICGGTAELAWRASLWCSYHEKLEEIQFVKALIWSQLVVGLSTVNCWPYQFYISRIFHHLPRMINWAIIILQHARSAMTTACRFKVEDSLGLL